MSAVKKETQGINNMNKQTYFYIIKSRKYMDLLYNEGKKECPILMQEIKVATVGQIYKPEKHPLLEQEKNVFLEMNTAQPLQALTATDHVEVVRSASLLNLSSALLREELQDISQESTPIHFFIETVEPENKSIEKTPPQELNMNKNFLQVPFYSPCRKNLNNKTECVQEISPINSTVAVATAALTANRTGPSSMSSNSPVAVATAALETTGINTPEAGPSKSINIKCPECHKIFTCCHDDKHKKPENKKIKNKSTFPCPKCEKEYTLE
ncbi:hypothetical protein PUN28_003772 [Cardiocondyla obscurior]|uniref:Uncharacterized protein n=1 Tax=Cardiocondyla obscurior TaxID=286306 RepID=A0AAW2GLZ6_9HYME